MEPKGYLALFMVVSLAFTFVYAVYTIPAQVALGGLFYFVDARIWASSLAYGGMAGAAAVLVLLAYRALKPLVGAGRRVMEYFTLSLAFYTMSAAAMTVGLTFFILIGRSFDPTVWYGLIYPYCLPVAMMFSGIAPYFMLKFSYWMAEQKDPGMVRDVSVLAPLALLLLIMVFPQNWFGVLDPRFSLIDMQLKTYPLGSLDPFFSFGVKVYPDLRPFSNGLLLLINLAAITQIIVFLHRKAISEPDPVRAARLRTVIFGFILILGFFACYTIDALIGGPFTIMMFIGFILMLLAIVLLYLGTAAPEWYVSRLQRRTKATSS